MFGVLPVQRIASRMLPRIFNALVLAPLRAYVDAGPSALTAPYTARLGALAIARWHTRLRPPYPPPLIARLHRVISRVSMHPVHRSALRALSRLSLRASVARDAALHHAPYEPRTTPYEPRVIAPLHARCTSRMMGRFRAPHNRVGTRPSRGAVTASHVAQDWAHNPALHDALLKRYVTRSSGRTHPRYSQRYSRVTLRPADRDR